MIRNVTFRRWVIVFALFTGLFTQFQTVFACELKDDMTQLICCCETPDSISKDCTAGDNCDDQHVMPKADNTACCELSYQPAPSATATAPELHTQQVLLLDAPQTPPILTSFDLQTISASSQSALFPTDILSRAIGTQTYLLTQRFRI